MDPPSSQSNLLASAAALGPSRSSTTGTTSGTTSGNNHNKNNKNSSKHQNNNKNNNMNVDICITCVTDKPPQLPLREELPSLGIEVVYNAQGIGARASQHEAQKLLEQFRSDSEYQDLKKRRLFKPSHAEVTQTMAERRKFETDVLEIPRGVSYEKYEKILSSSRDSQEGTAGGNNNGYESNSSLGHDDSGSTGTGGGESYTSSLGEKRKHEKFFGHTNKKRILTPTNNGTASSTSPVFPLKFSFPNSPQANFKEQQPQLQLHSQSHSQSHPDDSSSTISGGAMIPVSPFFGKSSPSSGFSSSGRPIQDYQGPADPATNNNNTGGGILTNNSSNNTHHNTAKVGGMFQSVLKAFSGDHKQRKQKGHHSLDDDEEDSPSESKSTSSEDRTVSGGSRSEDDEEERYRGPSMSPVKRRQQPVQQQQEQQQQQTTTAGSPKSQGDHTGSSSQDVSRDPSSISTNFTVAKPNNPSTTVEVLATNDPNVKKFLPGLQTVPSGSSSSVHVEEGDEGSFSGDEDRRRRGRNQKHKPQDPPVLPPQQQQHQQQQQQHSGQGHEPMLAEAFAAFTIHNNDDIYEKMGPATKVPKRQHHPHDGDDAPLHDHHPQQQNQRSNNNHDHATATTNSYTNNGTWINTAKMAFENVAAEVYKQATGSHVGAQDQQPSSSAAAAAAGTHNNHTLFDPTASNNVKQQQPLSPTSTLSSNTANQQQQQQIQIHGHQSFLFPNNNNSTTAGGLPNYRNKTTFHNHALHNPFPHLPHVEVHVRSDGTQVVVSSSIGTKSVTAFYEALQQPKTPVDSIQRMLRVCPGLVKVRLQQSHHERGRLGLHTACARGFLARRHQAPSSSSTGLALELVEDIQQLKRLIAILVEANRGACTVLDDQGDLPAHLLARTLMEWEAQWYEKVYEKVQKDQDVDGRNAAAITKLYQSMSQCIEIVLHPVAAFCNGNVNNNVNSNAGGDSNAATTLCRAPGSVGLLLPLHIASIFTASVPTLRQLLEQDPLAATVPCNLGHLRTFIPDHSLPLELHDKLSTDFPKWEIGAEARKSKPIQVAGGSLIHMEDYMRRSDLLFAFHPTVPRFRMETTRIERLEAKVISEANQMDQQFHDKGDYGQLSVAVKRIWIWLCTFQDINDHFQATYYPSVKRIVDSVPTSTIPYLASVKTMQGKTLTQVAAPECQALLRTRVEEYESTQASRLEQMVANAVATAASSSKNSITGSQDDTTTTNATAYLSLKGKGYVGVLCRTLFHIHEDSMPTSFILLPYRLTKNDQGKLGIDKQSSAATAVKFAECLLQLTDPKTILYFLEQKSIQAGDQRISGSTDEATSMATKKTCEQLEENLLALYEPGKAYLYLIDELIGLPIVPAAGTSLYPIELTQPSNIVRKLLPLMLTGMILMRGEKALSVLVNVLLDKSVTHVSSYWVDAAREITAYLYSQQDSRAESSLPGLDALINELRAFVSNNSSVKSSNSTDHSEWAVELSILRMVVSMNDNKRSFAGLKAKRDEPGTVLWTKHKIEEEMRSENKSGMTTSSSKDPESPGVPSYHEDPPGMVVHQGGSASSSKASTKKSGNQSYDDVSAGIVIGPTSSGPSKTGTTNPELSPLTESHSHSHTDSHKTPAEQRDIEELRMHSTITTPDTKHMAPDADKDDVSIAEADSGLEGEELAGVRILLEAEEGPSLLDQESTTEDEGTDSERVMDKYKSLYEKNNDSGSDSIRKKSTAAAPVESPPAEFGNKKKQSTKHKSSTGKDSRRPKTIPKTASSDSADSTVPDNDVYVDASGSSHSEDQMILAGQTRNSRRSGRSKGKQPYLEVTDSSGSDDQMTNSSNLSKTKDAIHNQGSQEEHESEESRSDSPSETHDTNESKSIVRLGSSETDDDDDEVLKFDIVNDTRSQKSSKSSPSSTGRSADRLYDESRIEVIDHHSVGSDENSVLSRNALESETSRLQDYALNRLTNALPSPPQSLPSPPPSPPSPHTAPLSTLPSKASSSQHSTALSNKQSRGNQKTTPTLKESNTASTFGDIHPASPIRSSPSTSILKNKTPSPSTRSGPSPGTPRLSTRSTPTNTTNNDNGNPDILPPPIRHASAILDSIIDEADEPFTISSSPSRARYGRENISKNKDTTFMDMREQLTDQAVKVDCLESTLESIRIREDKLLSRGVMLQDFLSDLLDQSENMKLDSENKANKLERQIGNLEERLLCNEIEAQHLSFGVYAIEEEIEAIADQEYKRELCGIIEHQVKQQRKAQQHTDGLDAILSRAAKVERIRSRSRDFSIDEGYDSSLMTLDGYSSNPDVESTSDVALDGYSRHTSGKSRRSRRTQTSHYSYDDYYVPYESSRPHPKHKSYNHHPRRRRRHPRPRPRCDYDMNQLLRNASLDERSIEYEMGLAMFGTLEHSDSQTSNGLSSRNNSSAASVGGGGGSPSPSSHSIPIRCNSLDAYEQMRSEYQLGVSALQDDTSHSENGYSSAGDYAFDTLEGDDGLDWVKMSTRQFEVHTYRQ